MEVKKHAKGLFATLEGMPAHLLIIVGLALTLLAPLILNIKDTSLAGSQAEFDQLKMQKELDLEEFKRDQADERKKSPEVTKYEEATEQRKPASFDAAMTPEQRDAVQKEEQEKDRALQELKTALDEKDKLREKALDQKKEELDQKYDTIAIRREMAEAQTAVAGTRSHLALGWLGYLLLLVGLLVLLFQSDGLRQKAILIVLLIVLCIALSGVSLDFQGRGRKGWPSYASTRMTGRDSEPPSSYKERIVSKVWKIGDGSRLEFKSDGRLVIMPPKGIEAENVNGTWMLNADEKKIVITLRDISETMEIVALSEKELKLKSNGQELSLIALEDSPNQ
ncbi:MAG TPA: hypothetical protein VJH03_13590 [Blastocatellia bacterium]|nr:hypothetical protein [Blastocatellia bacterium]